MPYDERLAERIRDLLGSRPDLAEQTMFGGLTMMLHGNMAVGVYGDSLLVRIDPANRDALRALPGAHDFVMSGRVARGFLLVSPQACADMPTLASWVTRGIDYAASLPPK